MASRRALLLLVGVGWLAPAATEVFFEENFEAADWEQRWVHSTWKGGNGPAGKFEWSAGQWAGDTEAQKGLRTPNDMNYHSISAKLAKPFSNQGRDLVVQFSVKHESQEFSFCGGGYIKLLGSDLEQATFGGSTPYKIMFGPDICGYDVGRIHAILTWQGENLLRKPDIGLEYEDKNEFTHIYTLVLKPDNSYTVYFDMKEKASGSLHEHFDFPNRTRDDPADRKPKDWVDVRRIDDPSTRRPDDWVDEQRMRDPTAETPAEWDEEEDGTWEAPFIDNPKYKGAWFPEQMDNPAYKGEWRPRQLGNPDFVEEVYAFDDIGAVGFELWTVNAGSVFDNILICDSFDHAKSAAESLRKVFDKEKDAKKVWEKATGKDQENANPEDEEEEDDDGDVVDIDAVKEEL